jgi:cell division septum initiation protein DivIVA
MFSRMKIMLIFALFAVQAETAKVTPVEKVIQLMQAMLEKGKKAKKEEQVQYNSYKQWCDETTVEKTRDIDEANQLIETLKADIQKYEADAELLAKEIAVHEEDISTWNRDIKAATKVREIEKADYDANHKDYTESIDALERAIQVLKKSAKDVPQSFVQVRALKNANFMKLIPEEAKQALDTMLSQYDAEYTDEALDLAAPEAAAYEHKSSGIIDMLEKLLNKFVDELTTLEKDEKESLHGFTMLMQDMDAQIADSTSRRDEKAEARAKKLQAKADAEAKLQDTTATRDDDVKYLADVTAQCEQKASDFADRQQLRQEEIEAIEKAIEIISSESVSGAASEHLPGLVQTQSTSLTQLRADGMSSVQQRVIEFLKKKSTQLNSRVLSVLAARAGADPFKKVRKMIKDLITKLQEEAAAEADHKEYCDTELASNEQTRKEKTEAIEALHAEIDELEATIAKLTEEITELQAAIAAIDKAVKEATEIRAAEKKKNTQTIADAKEAQEAVEKALQILKDFYAKAGQATALVQQPEIFDQPYKGMGGESGGVIGMLEVILSDFARLEAETTTAEEEAQKEYDAFMADAETDKHQKDRDIEHKVKKKQDKSQALEEHNKDLEGTRKELDAALAYYDKLKPDCIDAGVSYEERVARRKEEIESLQEALKILNGM